MSKLRTEVTIEVLNQRSKEFLPDFLGIEMVEIRQDSLISRMPVTRQHFAPNGFLHAASVVAIADSTCGYATAAHLPDGAQSFTTIELKSNHLGTVKEGSVCCTAQAQHLGRNTHVWDAVVTDEVSGRKIALFRCTQMILWAKP